MAHGAADRDGRRCPKHPSQPPFTGFCSACLLDRLHATDLVLPTSPSPAPQLQREGPRSLHHDADDDEGGSRMAGPAAGRTTLLRLFQLEDQGADPDLDLLSNSCTVAQAGPSTSGSQDPAPAQQQQQLQRKRSLRHSCSDWIACCDNHPSSSSCLPSRQSMELDSTAAPLPLPLPAAPTNPHPTAPATCAAAAETRRTGSLRWGQAWPIRGSFLARPSAGHLLSRSFSESSSRSRRHRHHPDNANADAAAMARSSSSRSQGVVIHRNGSSSTGMDSSEISLPDDSSHHHHCRPRLKHRLHWLRRSRSVHYSPTALVDATPSLRSRSSSTRSTATADKSAHQLRRLNLGLFAAGFFGSRRHHHHQH